MKDLEKELREILQHKLDNLQSTTSLRSGTFRRVAVRQTVSLGAIFLTLVVATLGGFFVGQAVLDSSSSAWRPAGPPAASASADENSRSGPRPLTRKTVVASGQKDNQSWSVVAFRAVDEGPATEQAGTAGKEMLCLELNVGAGADLGAGCVIGLEKAFGTDDYFYATANLVQGSPTTFYGTVSRQVAQIELQLEDGSVTAIQTYSAPRDLGVGFDFFVGFAPPHTDVVVLAKDRAGRVLETQNWQALPLLKVTKAGSGNGTVTGTPTEEPICTGSCPEHTRWIDCGTLCSAELDDASITLEAQADPGSIFVGWSGDCTGTGPCTLIVDTDKSVTAMFEKP